MKTIILGGFLGAGKTTIVMQLARFLVGGDARKNKVVIVENEIGEIGVDDMLLRGDGYEVSELFNGCACCTMAGEFRGSVRRIQKELDPEWLIVEATGVAYPLPMKETLDPILESPAIICTLVDANRLRRILLPVRELVSGQLTDASCILINKVDLVDAEKLRDTENIVREFNSHAPIFKVSGLQEIDPAIWQLIADLAAGKEV